jgi:hypothetical protein
MTTFRQTVLSLFMTAAAFGAYAQTDAEHAQHHPSGTTQKASKATVAKAKSMLKESIVAMDSKMEMMRVMHEKMIAANTPEERKALMADHMKAMQDGMNMMGSMASMGGMKDMGGMDSGANKGEMRMDMVGHHEMMEKRMEMMTTMMQMMMDRLPDDPAK